MIPNEIKRGHVLAALVDIDQSGVLVGRQLKKFAILHDGKKYPPKYVLSLAAKQATGVDLPSSSFGGGNEANHFLKDLGFQVVALDGRATPLVVTRSQPKKRPVRARKVTSASSHNERCADCKIAVESLLRSLYGSVEKNPRIEASTNPEDYRDSALHPFLNEIYTALQQHRGHREFVRSSTMPNCDFWVPDPGFIVEFDESQHFTECRAAALVKYPGEIGFGFDRELWARHCGEIQAEDHDPPFRDEQRAWYDTLRDFVPHVKRFQPTLRLFASEFQWCGLDPRVAKDLETFRQILGERANFWRLEFSDEDAPVLARVVIDSPWRGDVGTASQLLADICGKWPKGKKVQCITTCGAFLRFDWPGILPQQENNLAPDPEAMATLEKEGKRLIDLLLKPPLIEQLRSCTNYLTLGVDSFKDKISTTQTFIPEPHAEMVYVVDLSNLTVHFTAKSYPTPGQEKGLLRNTNLNNHFVELGGNQAMILGCHDLTIFNPRSDATATGWRLEEKDKFKNLAATSRPRWVLHHPHTAIKKRTWLAAWAGLIRSLPSVESYVGSGTYSRKDKGWEERDDLREVLAGTKSRDVMDIIVHMAQI